MKAVVFHAIGNIQIEDVPEPQIQDQYDAIIRITSSAICGTDLHMIRGTMGPMKEGTVMGHEGVGVVEKIGKGVRNFKEGDRVVLPSTIACGTCSYCRAGYYSQCDLANPNGPRAGTAFFGGPELTGPFNGMQAEKVRFPYANIGLVKIPDMVSDDDAIMVSDIFPTGYFGAELAEITSGDTVAVFGCGPVGQFAILSAFLMGASRVIAIDRQEDRLEMARAQGAEVINFDKEKPVDAILDLTRGIGVDRVIDAVGVDAEHAHHGPAAEDAEEKKDKHESQVEEITLNTNPEGDVWVPGDAPSQALEWAVQGVAKAGTLGIIGVYPQTVKTFPIGQAMMKNLSIHMGNCPHRRYIPYLLDLIQRDEVNPQKVMTKQEPLTNVIDAYKAFDTRQPGWIKVKLD